MDGYYTSLQEKVVNRLRIDSEVGSGATVVPIRRDYNEKARCLALVAFPPADLAQAIHQTLIKPLQGLEGNHHYYLPESLHVTIKNVRTIHYPLNFDNNDIEKAKEVFEKIIPQHPVFSFSLKEVVPFRTSVALIGYCNERFRSLVHSLDEGLIQADVPDDKQYASSTVFFGNVTLCRFAQIPSRAFLEEVERLMTAFQDEFKVEVVKLTSFDTLCSKASQKIWGAYCLL